MQLYHLIRNIHNRFHPCHIFALEEGGPLAKSLVPRAWDEPDASQYRLDSLQRNALARGRALLQDLISRTPPENVEELAAAWLELADWNQWNDKRAEALAAYANAERLLREAGEAELLRQWLGHPVELGRQSRWHA